MATPKIPETLIVVCAHAIYSGPSTPPPEEAPPAGSNEESDWHVESFQVGETPTFIKHVEAGVTELRRRLDQGEEALLVFSGGGVKSGLMHGGEKREEVVGGRGERSEGGGYFALAKARRFFGLEDEQHSLEKRMVVEAWSTDSFQNALFSLITFQRHVAEQILKGSGGGGAGRLRGRPKKLVIVAHEFKRKRFMDLHVRALKFSKEGVELIGLDPDWSMNERVQTIRGESERGYKAWENDLYGTGELLYEKRRQRGWDEEAFMTEVLGEEKWEALGDGVERVRDWLVALVRWRGGGGSGFLFQGKLPWDDDV